jgi:hypothetical protein
MVLFCYFIFSFYGFWYFSVLYYCGVTFELHCMSLMNFGGDVRSQVLWGDFNISFCHHRMLHHFGGYRLGCADCACGSWSDLLRVIVRDHFVNFCLGSYHDRMLYFDLIVCPVVEEGRGDFVGFVFCTQLVLLFAHLSYSATECVHHVFFHGDLISCCISRTRRCVKIREKLQSRFFLLV